MKKKLLMFMLSAAVIANSGIAVFAADNVMYDIEEEADYNVDQEVAIDSSATEKIIDKMIESW